MRHLTVLTTLISVAVAFPVSARTPVNVAAPSVRVEAFSPQGTVKGVRQVSARFSEPMVPFGATRGLDPFSVDCPTAGQGRWLDSRNWVYDFAHDLPAGLRCSFALDRSIRSLAGRRVDDPPPYRFDTGGPSVIDSLPGDGAHGIDSDPAMLLALDAPATAESIAAHAHCEIDGLGEQIAVRVLTDAARQQVLNQELRHTYRDFFENFANEQAIAQRLVVLQCQRRFPPDTAIRVVWGKGIAAAGSGLATTADQTLAFRTRAAFTARFECERVNAEAQCVPFLPMKLSFSAPVATADARGIRLVGKSDGHRYLPEPAEVAAKATVDEVVFKGPFPEAAQFEIRLPAELQDDAGRKLENAARFPFQVATDEYPPLAKFAGEFGIIEANEGGVLPVTLRNLEGQVAARQLAPALAADRGVAGQLQRIEDDDRRILDWLKTVKAAAERRGEWIEQANTQPRWKELTGSTSVFASVDGTTPFSVPKPLGDKAFEVVGIPLTKPGFYVVELASPRLGAALLGEPVPRYVATAALVTNLGVHFKWGRESSRVWVTTLDRGTVVPNAAIRISDSCTGHALWRGTTGPDGLATIRGEALSAPTDEGECGDWNASNPPLFVSARANGVLGFTHSGWSQGIQPRDFGLATGSPNQARVAHAVLDRTLLRTGETVSMKLFLRQRGMDGFAIPAGDGPNRLRLTHSGSGQEYTLPIAFDARGIAESRWSIPREAKLGGYDIKLYRDDQWLADTGQFQVQQFRVPTMRAVIQPGNAPLINARTAAVDLFVGYLSGGGAGGLPVIVRTQLRPRAITYPAYEDFVFGGQDVAEGIQDPVDDEAEPAAGPARTLPLTLDRTGAARATLTELPPTAAPQDLIVELDYPDANGERLTVAQRIPLWPAKLTLGLRTEHWAASRTRLKFDVLALDLDGKPMSAQPVVVELFGKTTFSYRKRLVGGFYAYENRAEFKRLAPRCETRTDRAGLASCEVTPDRSGEIVLRATAKDDRGNTALATRDVWVAAGDDWWFEGGPSDRMDVLPERSSYEAGDTARFQVRSPFREATALVTVEREGVLDAFVTELSGKTPVVDVPIKAHYAPNVYISVLAVRGRATDAFAWLKELGRTLHLTAADDRVTATVDLSKPAYRLGTRGIDVGWKPYRLDVAVRPDRDTYQVRDQAKIKLTVSRADGGPLPDAAELAFAAVDEGLLELKPNTSWLLLDDMMDRRGLEVFTSTAQMQVVGKRHYGRKAVPHGGGGGRQPARELFDTLLLWRGRVPLDATGHVELDVPLNDSITAFRLTAIADAGTGHFGTGAATIRTTQELALHSGLPPLVREGDTFTAIVTARNASGRRLTVEATANLTSQPSAVALPVLAPQSVTVPPGEARELHWTLTVPPAIGQLTWDLAATERDGGTARDHAKITQSVVPAVPVRVQQATLVQVGQPLRLEMERPDRSLPERGGVRVELRNALGNGGDGVRDYMRTYPYSCLEQRVSRAIALRDHAQWDDVIAQLPGLADDDGLLKYFPADRLQGSDTLTSYVLAVAHAAGWPLPGAVQTRALDALKSFVEGRLTRDSAAPAADRVLRKLTAIEALARYGRAQPAMLASLTIEPNLWPTSAVLDWLGILQRLDSLPRREVRLQETLQILRSRLSFRGATAGFSTEPEDRLPWLMVSADANLARLILALSARDDWRDDLPRVVSGAMGRQIQGRWDTTVANAWATLALEKFGAAFQGTAVDGVTTIKLADKQAQWHFGLNTAGGTLDFPWPDQAAWLELEHQGQGAPWATIQSRAAIALLADDFHGFTLRRTVQPVEQRQAGVWSRGDVARIRLDLEAQADMAWVVVDDPIPAGASILGTGLGRDAALLTSGERRESGVSPIYEERRFDAFRAYYDYVPKGTWAIEYTVRANNAGRFALPPSRVEALYAPDVFGAAPNPAVEIVEP